VERLGNQFMVELLRVTGANVEELGNILNTNKELTDEDLRNIQFALRRAADAIEMIRDGHTTVKFQD